MNNSWIKISYGPGFIANGYTPFQNSIGSPIQRTNWEGDNHKAFHYNEYQKIKEEFEKNKK